MASLESMTWGSILVRDKKQNHTVAVTSLCKEAQDRLLDIQLDDQDALVSLRFGSRERAWGFREKNYFFLIWWDPEHKVCPSFKKHT